MLVNLSFGGTAWTDTFLGGAGHHAPAGGYRPNNGRFVVYATGLDGGQWRRTWNPFFGGSWGSWERLWADPALDDRRETGFIGTPSVALSRSGGMLALAHRWSHENGLEHRSV